MTDVRDYLETCRLVLNHEAVAALVSHAIGHAERCADDPMPFYDLARVAELCGRMDLWQRGVAIALPLPHDAPRSQYYRGCAKRRLGDWSGWRDNEARRWAPWAIPIGSAWTTLSWTASLCENAADLGRKALLVVDEGGFGDSLQSLCFVRPLIALARRIIVATKPELVTLVDHNFGCVADIIASDAVEAEARIQFDAYIWSWSVPMLFDGIPSFEPLIAPRAVPRSAFDRDLVQIGLCWGASDYRLRRSTYQRSLPGLHVLETVFRVPGVEWHSLQTGPAVTDAAPYPVIRPPVLPLGSFAETANLIVGLDGVVTVDTSVAHLAGRLGVPTFLLLPYASDDRWGLVDSTPWYPSMRIIRQRQPGNWLSVVESLAHHVSALRVRHPTARSPSS
jgi:hypothetical protein